MNNKEPMINLKEVLGFIIFMLCVYILFISVQTIDMISKRLDRVNVEYQFVVTDDSISVYDDNRVVGTVKIEGQLDSLIIADNK